MAVGKYVNALLCYEFKLQQFDRIALLLISWQEQALVEGQEGC
jgi:hypothetical protein